MSTPTVPWLDAQADWVGVVETIEGTILPHLLKGAADFVLCTGAHSPTDHPKRPSNEPLHALHCLKEAIGHLCFLLQGQAVVTTLRGKRLVLKAPAGCWVPSNDLTFLHTAPDGSLLSNEWLVCSVMRFGTFVTRCQMAPKAHYEGPLHLLVEPMIPAFVEDWEECSPLSWKRRLMAFWSLMARMQPTLPTFWELLSMRVAEMPLFLQNLLQLLHRAYLHPLRLQDIARWSHVHPSHLCRLFRRWLGVSPGEYLTRLRLSAAWQLLTQTNLPATLVGQIVGYRDYHHFRKQFMRKFKVSPCQMRRNPHSLVEVSRLAKMDI